MKYNFLTSRRRTGAAMLMAAGAAIFLIGMTALVTDLGWYYYNKVRLETAVNASWKAGFDHIHELQGYNNQPLNDGQKSQVIQRIREIAAFNGLTSEQVAAIDVIIGPQNELEVKASHDVGLFFARVVDNQISMSVAAERGGDDAKPVYVVPLAIPHGVVKDLSKHTYDVTLFPDPDPSLADSDEGCTRFKEGVEYIIKLGRGQGLSEQSRILVPMGPGDQSTKGYRRAYGAAYWCLGINENDNHFAPVHWLLGYRGGAFMLINAPEVKQILNNYGVNFQEITGNDNINAIYDIVGEHVMEVWDRPRIAVYSSTSSPDPVEVTLRNAKIPYGPYSLPGEWPRNESYNSNKCSSFYDEAVLSGEIDKYHWLHLHHEDFTGFSGGCKRWKHAPENRSSDPDCWQNYRNGLYGRTNSYSRRVAAREYFCDYCYEAFDPRNGSWGSRYRPYRRQNCRHYKRRCAEFATHVWWKRYEEIKPQIPGPEYNKYLYRYSPRSKVRNYICYSDDTRPNCRGYNRIFDIATDFGFTDDPGSVPKPKANIHNNGNLSLGLREPNWFDTASRVQKMKWQVANTIKDHVQEGGFLFAQCFAPETFDMALFQSQIYAGKSNAEAYQHTLAFTNFEYHATPYGNIPLGYSTINTREYPGNQPFYLLLPFDPRTQNHGTPDTRTGHTAAFNANTVKSSITVLGRRTNNANRIKYVGSELSNEMADGVFSFLGGHHMGNVEAERLVLNNILFGSLSEKEVTEGSSIPMPGRTKHSYGPVDPTNTDATPEDYAQLLTHGFNSPLQLNDRISNIPEANLADESLTAVEYRVTGSLEDEPIISRRIVVPITDVGPEIATNSEENADAIAIYDMLGKDVSNEEYDPDSHDFGSSVRIIGFAEFELLMPDDYTRAGTELGDCHTGALGTYQTGQIRGIFIRYIVNPHEVANFIQ